MKLHISIAYNLNKTLFLFALCALLLSISAFAYAEVIDPEKYIKDNGYHSVKTGDDGTTPFYTHTVRVKKSNIKGLEKEIGALSKSVEVYQTCTMIRDGAKTDYIKQGVLLDVTVPNYGYRGSTIACVLKYIQGLNIGTQLIYMKKGAGGMYMVYVTD